METALQKVQAAEDAWNTRDPEKVCLAYTIDTEWRNRTEFINGREEVKEFLKRKWEKELDYKLKKELWGFRENRMAVRFEYEWHNSDGQWFRSYGNELWEFDENGYMQKRFASINDLPIPEEEHTARGLQQRFGSRSAYARLEEQNTTGGLTENETLFISLQDNFYMSTVGESGYPYIQFRGGPKGFLKVIDDQMIGFLDFEGNKQYISVGNLATNNKAALFLLDQASKTRLKIYADVEVVEISDDPQLAQKLDPDDYKYTAFRILLFHVKAFDWNCPKHITPRYSLAEIQEEFAAQHEYINKLREEIKLFSFTDDNYFDQIQRHNYYTIIWVTSGNGKLKTDFSESSFGSNTMFTFSLYQPFMITGGAIEGLVLNFHPEFFCIYKHHKEKSAATFKMLAEQLRSEMQNTGLAQYELLVSYLKIFLINAARLKAEQHPRYKTDGGKEPFMLQNLKDAIDEHYKEKHSASEYADLLNISAKALGRLAKNHFNKTITDLIAERIVIEAKRELYLTNKPVKEIAFELGYNDEYYFSRFFKTNASVSPQTYRETLNIAIPQLDSAHLTATFFLIGDLTSQTTPRWRAVAKKGYELANHTLYHPCTSLNDNPVASENYTVARTYAYPCTETAVNGKSYVDSLRKSGRVKYARIGGDTEAVITDFKSLDPMLVPSYGLN
eukprot:gene16268-16447_t